MKYQKMMKTKNCKIKKYLNKYLNKKCNYKLKKLKV